MKNRTGIVLFLAYAGIVFSADSNREEKPMADHVKMDGKRVWIDGVKGYALPEPLFEGVAVVVRQLGSTHSARQTHAMASGFLREIAPRHEKAKAELERAAACFQAEAEVLEKGRDLLWWSAPEGPDAERNKKATELLAQARDHYAAGIAAIEKALENLK
jgi:hypothetical protein